MGHDEKVLKFDDSVALTHSRGCLALVVQLNTESRLRSSKDVRGLCHNDFWSSGHVLELLQQSLHPIQMLHILPRIVSNSSNNFQAVVF